MGWFANLFSSSSSTTSSRRNMALSSHDAFSLPTSSPVFATHPDSFARGSTPTPEQNVASPSYAYPPQSSSSPRYDSVPNTARSRQTSTLLPLHSGTPLSPLPPYPALDQTWQRIRNWLGNEYPELGDTLNWGIQPQDLADIEMAFGFALPPAVRESYLVVDGQEAESAAGCAEGLFFGLTFLPLEDVMEEWQFWREVDGDPATGANESLRDVMQSIPDGWVRRQYSCSGWIPLVTDKAGNYLGVDLNPGEKGSVGQVIVFGRDFDTKVVMHRGDGPAGWARWLASFVEELESGEGFELGNVSDGSEGSEDDVGYDSYFFDGNGRAKGEGGGDSGTGGLRYTGDYKGWNVLEAWADRSVKRWLEAGVIHVERDPEESTPTKATEKDIARSGLGIIDMNAVNEADAATKLNGGLKDSIPSPNTKKASGKVSPRAAIPPAISISKPPAPLPVALPSPMQYRPTSPLAASSFDKDLERGSQDALMDEIESSGPVISNAPQSPTTPTTPTPRKPTPTPAPTTDVDLLPLDQSEIPTEVPSSANSSQANEMPPKSEPIPDLLQTDGADGVEISPIQPAASPLVEPLQLESIPNEPSSSNLNEPGVSSNGKETHALPDGPEVDQTIRLVGGGGTVGLVSSEPEPTEPEPLVDGAVDVQPSEPDKADVASITSTGSGAKPHTGGKHKKEKSFSAGLKKLGKLGGGTRKAEKDKHKDST
ncbi:hypothetical protein BD410DRAFT_59222 [Rickenella mellea]|uniref:Knr4/Smi1-like domain-containing protein n=1 Tax=Rickenella mellea TaxID=50990 RepID=A0A4Y7QBT9_9AGAM|nr:hypothetical protein BD410DRAFT_59222 [Rickenella mellea]